MKVLVVVDMQNDFIDGSLGTPQAQAIVKNVKAKIEEYHKNNSPVVFTRDTHNKNYLETQEGKNLPIVHCVKDTYGVGSFMNSLQQRPNWFSINQPLAQLNWQNIFAC